TTACASRAAASSAPCRRSPGRWCAWPVPRPDMTPRRAAAPGGAQGAGGPAGSSSTGPPVGPDLHPHHIVRIATTPPSRPHHPPRSASGAPMTDPAPTLATGLISALTAPTPGSRASGSTGPSAAPTDGPARVVVNLDLPGATISRHLYGHFAEHLGRCIYGGFFVGEDSEIPNTRGIRDDVVAALRALKIPNLRWPGGCFADEYHWRDVIGPLKRRPAMLNSHWDDIA